MTAQIKDKLILEDGKYHIIASSSQIPFDPKDYGLFPMSCCTACYRGYWCEYVVKEENLYLDKLYIHTDGIYPKLNGIPVSAQEYESVSVQRGKEPERFPKNLRHRVYEHIGLPVLYTGFITVEKDIHRDGDRSKHLLELCFEDGKITNKTACGDIPEGTRFTGALW